MDRSKLFGYNLLEWLNENLDCSSGTRDQLTTGEIIVKEGKVIYRFKVGGWFVQGEYDSKEYERKEKDMLRKREERKHTKREIL